MTRMSLCDIPGPSFLGILSPAATSITYMKKSTNAGEKVRVRLSPPLSMRTISVSGNFSSISSTAAIFIEGSSLTAVWGQAPVSTPMILSSRRIPLRVLRTCLASSVVTMSLVMIKTFCPSSRRRGVIASISAVLPEPTGPPIPILQVFDMILLIFFMQESLMIPLSFLVHKHSHITFFMKRCEYVEFRVECIHVLQFHLRCLVI